MIFNTKRIHKLLLKKFLRESSTNSFKSFICRQEKATAVAVRSLRAKIVIVGNSIWVKNHHFCAQLTHCFLVYTKTIIHLRVGG